MTHLPSDHLELAGGSVDRTTILHKLESSERHRLEINGIRSRDFRYILLIPVFELVVLGEIIAHKLRSFANRWRLR